MKAEKCQFGMIQCTYLGHKVGGGIVKPKTSKIHAVKSFPKPHTKREVQTFLGLTEYYRRFIPDFASIAALLSDLTKKQCSNIVNWYTKSEKAFHQLKQALCSSPVIHSPDFTKEFVLQTDALEQEVGAVLCQRDVDGKEHPVTYFSHKLLPREERYLHS